MDKLVHVLQEEHPLKLAQLILVVVQVVEDVILVVVVEQVLQVVQESL